MWYMVFAILGGAFVTLLITLVVRGVIYYRTNKGETAAGTWKCIGDFFLTIFSPDYRLADRAKARLECDGNRVHSLDDQLKDKALYIQTANRVNLLLSLILCAGVVVLKYCCKNTGEYFVFALFGFLGYRLLSRTVEINVAFLGDCFDKNKNRYLDKYMRIKLAFTSLLEEAILFAGAYTLAEVGWWNALLGGAHSFILSPFSNGICVRCPLFQFITIYQVICTIVLLTIAFATYISTPENGNCNNGNNGERGNNGGNGNNVGNDDGGDGGAVRATATAAVAAVPVTVSNGATTERTSATAQASATPTNTQKTMIKVAITAAVALAVVVLVKRR